MASLFRYIVSRVASASTGAGNTRWFGIAGNALANIASNTPTTKIYEATTAKLASAKIAFNSIAASSSITLTNGGVNTDLAIVVPAEETGVFENITDTVSLAVDDLISWKVVGGGSSGSVSFSILGLVLDAASGMEIVGGNEAVSQNLTRFYSIGGLVSPAAVEVNAQYQLPTAATFDKARVAIAANSLTGSSTLTLRKNGADTALSITIPGGETGTFENTVDTASFAIDDLANWQLVTGAGTNITPQIIQMRTNAAVRAMMTTALFGGSFNFNGTQYYYIEGHLAIQTTEALTQFTSQQAATLRNGRIRVTANDRNANIVYTLRKNGVDSAISITVPASSTGVFTSAQEVAVADGDLLNWARPVGGDSGSQTITWIAVEYEAEVVGGATVTGDAGLSGVGTVAATGEVTTFAEAALSGVGSVVAAGQVVKSGQLVMSGVGTVTTEGVITVAGQAQMSGVGALVAVSEVTGFAEAALSGVGSVAVTGQATVSGAAAMSGVGTLAVQGKATVSGAVAMSGAGTLTPTATPIVSSSANMSGVGNVVAAGQVRVLAVATASGIGTVAAQGIATSSGQASISGVGTLTAAGDVSGIVTGEALLSGVGTIAAAGQATTTGEAVISGVGTVASQGLATIPGEATISGTGALAATAAVTVHGAADMAGVGTLAAAGDVQGIVTAAAQLSGVGTVTGTATVTGAITGAASLSGLGTLTAQAAVTTTGQADLSGAGNVVISGKAVTASAVSLSGSGTMAVAGNTHVQGHAAISGAGQMSAIVAVTVIGQAALSGTSNLSAITRLLIFTQALLTGVGSLTASGIIPQPIVKGTVTISDQLVHGIAVTDVLVHAGTSSDRRVGGLEVKDG